jgi:predicted ATPase
MKIQGFRVRKYRNIEDSGYVNLLSSLTCIVGKNQSGKTALLKALYKFNPYRADPYDLRREWPRGQRTTRNSNQVVCEVNFKLEEEEKRTLAALTGQALTATEVTVSRNYEGRFEVRFPEQPDFFPDALHASNERAHDYIITRIPTFIYMDDYKRFRGNAHLDTVKQKLADTKTIPLTEEDETFLMILRLAGLDLDQLVAQGNSRNEDVLHDRQLDLQDAATTLTANVAGRWGQNNYKIHFRADGQFFFTDIEEIDKSIGMIPLEEQSKGFQWFFSFDFQFMHDSEGTFEGCVLLLDEPGLHLHPGGQADLLKRLDAYSEKNTTIYSTHLPFLIDLREPSRIRVITRGDGGAVVSDDLGASQSDEKLTLQAALGMRANQSYSVADRNLVVEGVDDYWILIELSNILQRSGEKGLPNDIWLQLLGERLRWSMPLPLWLGRIVELSHSLIQMTLVAAKRKSFARVG